MSTEVKFDLQKISEWVNLIQLGAIVFGGGIMYQKVDHLSIQVTEKNQTIQTLTDKVTAVQIDLSTVNVRLTQIEKTSK